MRHTVWTAAVVIFLVGVQIDPVDAKGGGGSHQSAGNSASLLRGNNGDNKKGGRYLAAPLKKLPGKKEAAHLDPERRRKPHDS
jgi:hypothetical protein